MSSLAIESRSNRFRWPMTPNAWLALADELAQLRATIASLAVATGEAEHVMQFRIAQAARRLDTLTAVFNSAEQVDEPGRVVIGRRPTLDEDGSDPVTYALVYPGDGDPTQGWISADSPIGSAILGAAVGDRVEVVAPAGRRVVTITGVE